MKVVIAIDGPAGSGKSTVARKLAEKHSAFYQIDSGALYRSYTYLGLKICHRDGIDLDTVLADEQHRDEVKNAALNITFINGQQRIKLGDIDMEHHIREPEITRNIKSVADSRLVRDLVNDQIRQLANEYPLIADGRDMGTEVFPDAQMKFFITASVEERAKRRYQEFKASAKNISLEQVTAELGRRDKEDEGREYGALRKADDAIFIDTSSQTLKAVLEQIENHLVSKGSADLLALIKEPQ